MGRKHTEFYDLLDVKPDATPAQLKKAYYKAALRLHPDKGGDPKVFQEMKDAYDVLSDPNKRKIYDTYGPLMLKVMSGNGSPEDSLKVLGFLRKREKLAILSVFSLITMFLLLFPILLSLQWNGSPTLTWATAFIPLWVLQFLMVLSFYLAVQGPKLPEEMDPEEKEAFKDVTVEIRRLQIWFGTTMLLLVVSEIFIVLRLQEVIQWSWYLVLLPILVLIAFYVGYHFYKGPVLWRKANLIQEPKRCDYISSPGFWIYILNATKWKLLWLISIILIATIADGRLDVSYYIGILPLLVGAVLQVLWSAFHPLQDPTMPQGDLEQQNNNLADADEKKVRFAIPWGQICCVTGPWVLMVCLAAAKLDDNGAFSAFIVFIPVFLVLGCTCCVLSCTVACISPEVFEEMEKAEREKAEKEEAKRQTSGLPVRYGSVPSKESESGGQNQNQGQTGAGTGATQGTEAAQVQTTTAEASSEQSQKQGVVHQ